MPKEELPPIHKCYRCGHDMRAYFMGMWSLLKCSFCKIRYERSQPLDLTIEEWNKPEKESEVTK